MGILRFSATMAALLLLAGGTAFSQIDHSMDDAQIDPGRERVNMDKNFLKSTLDQEMYQAQLEQLALQKSNNDQVKQLAKQLADDHGGNEAGLKPIAETHKVPVPTQLDKKEQKNLAKISSLSGADFDQAYIREELKANKAELQSYHDEVASFKTVQYSIDPTLEGAATDGAQLIDHDLQLTQDLAKSQNVK